MIKSLNKKPRQKYPAYICFVGDKNPKQKVDIRGLILQEPNEESLIIKYDVETNSLYAMRGKERYPVEFDYG